MATAVKVYNRTVQKATEKARSAELGLQNRIFQKVHSLSRYQDCSIEDAIGMPLRRYSKNYQSREVVAE